MFYLQTGLAVRACPLRSDCKVKAAPADLLRQCSREVQIFTFFTIFSGFYRCFIRKSAHRKNLSYERVFLLFQRNVQFFRNVFYDAWKSEKPGAPLPQMIALWPIRLKTCSIRCVA